MELDDVDDYFRVKRQEFELEEETALSAVYDEWLAGKITHEEYKNRIVDIEADYNKIVNELDVTCKEMRDTINNKIYPIDLETIPLIGDYNEDK